MNAAELISKAFILIGIVSVEVETPSAGQSQDGLFWLNNVLRRFSGTGTGIPYVSNVQLNLVAGQEIYEVPNLISIHNLTFNLGTVRYSLRKDGVNNYFGTPRANDISALPYHYYQQRVKGGSNLWLYFLPLADMVLNIVGMYGLPDVDYSTDLDETYDGYYQTYILYLLAQALWVYYFPMDPLPVSLSLQLEGYREEINSINPPDLALTKGGLYNGRGGVSYAQINLGRGYEVP